MVKKKVKKKVIKKVSKKEKELILDHEIAFDFATKVYKRFQEVIKSVVLFGSVAKHEIKKGSDIDVIIFVDDCTVQWDDELIAWYREELSRLTAKQSYKDKIHVNTITVTTFWDEIRMGEPLAINVIRYGEAMVDHGGFFEPLKVLLAKGRIRPTAEAIFTTMVRAENHLEKANRSVLLAVEGYYWACVDSAHSALMAENVIPPSPEFIPDLLKDFFVKSGKINKKLINYFDEVRSITKDIEHGVIKRISASQLKDIESKSTEFVKTFRSLTKFLIKDKKIIKIEPKQL